MRIILIADPHVGLDRFGATPDEWDMPLNEAADYAIEKEADGFVIAGDVQNSRNPTMAQHWRMRNVVDRLYIAGLDVVGSDGNHDRGASADSVPVTALLDIGDWYGGSASIGSIGRASLTSEFCQLVSLPWPRPVDYGPSPYVLDADPQEATREGVLNRVNVLCGQLDPDQPAILIGHSMLTYGESSPEGPNLAFGKDVLLPASFFRDLPNIGACFFGHCHVPDQFYIGSTQPTDWSMAGVELSFIELEIARDLDTIGWEAATVNGWTYRWRRIPYKTSLRLADVRFAWRNTAEIERFFQNNEPSELIAMSNPDVVRFTADLGPELHVDAAEIRKRLESLVRRVESVNIIPWRGEKRRSEMAGEGLAALDRTQIPEAVRAWAQERSQPPEIADRLASDTRALQEDTS